MKTILSIASIAALAFSGSLSAQTAYSKPSGYITLGNAAGTSDLPNNTDCYVSVPLLANQIASATVTTRVGQVITLNIASLGNLMTEPHIAIFSDGVVGLITANNASTVTMSADTDTSSATVNSVIAIHKATTLATLFSSISTVTQNGGFKILINSGSNIGTNLAFDLVYSWYGVWYNAQFQNASNVVIYPGESFVIRNSTGTNIDNLIVSGEVAMGSQSFVFEGESVANDTLFAPTLAATQSLADLGLRSTSNDQILIFNNSATGINKSTAQVLQNYGTNIWYNSLFQDVTNTFKFEPGAGYIYRKAPRTADLKITYTPTYSRP